MSFSLSLSLTHSAYVIENLERNSEDVDNRNDIKEKERNGKTQEIAWAVYPYFMVHSESLSREGRERKGERCAL